MEKEQFKSYSGQKLMYIFRINDDTHKDLLKIGDATNHGADILNYLEENSEQLNKDAISRIGDETITAGVPFDLLYSTISITKDGKSFRDKRVHKVLTSSGIKRVELKNDAGKATEWFKCDLQTAINAIKAVKEGRHTLNNNEISSDKSPVILREEQKRFIAETKKSFKKHKTHLWNAKMRFGKTITALSLVKEQGYKKVLIYTHRPVVNAGWFEDYQRVFWEDTDTMKYGSHLGNGSTIEELIFDNKKFGTPFIYFASLQDLRGKTETFDWRDRNKKVFDTEWDLVIIDEVHEGTRTELGKKVYAEVNKPKTKILSLSGTPFSVMGEFDEDNTSTWDYVEEQEKKANWDENNGPNPYTCPKMNIFTYQMGEDTKDYNKDSNYSFNFREFFRVFTGKVELDGKIVSEDKLGKFVHEDDVVKFLNLLTKEDKELNYPFSTKEYRDMFNHTLWMVPGVKEAKALSELLQKHKVFQNYKIVNVAGPGDEDVENDEALKMVREAIKDSEYTITLSCGRLTTGVTVPEWNAILYLCGSKTTGAQNYLQTIFRVQSPYQKNGKVKENAYVFDFAPDRVLTIVPQLATITTHNKYSLNDIEKRERIAKILNFLPVIAKRDSSTIEYDVESMMGELKKATAERVALEGFDDIGLYNQNKLLTLTDVDIKKFNDLCGIIGRSNQERTREITINAQGLTEEDLQTQTRTISRTPLTEEEKKERQKLQRAQKQRNDAVSILRGIAVKIPLLVYGLDAEDDEEENITLNNFTDLIDDDSFEQFMPRGITKEKFNEFKEYFDSDVFNIACKNIRQKVKDADKLPPLERVYEIAEIFDTFRNPDKETVFTPWRVVNKHMQFSLGGYNLYKEDPNANPYDPSAHRLTAEEVDKSFKDNGEITKDTLLNLDSKILDIYSKTGLYSLYVCYNIFRERLKQYKGEVTQSVIEDLWFTTIEKNIYALCKTKMAKSITLRTLCGFNVTRDKSGYHIKDYSGVKNFKYVDDYITNAKENQDELVKAILDDAIWNSKDEITVKKKDNKIKELEKKEEKVKTKSKKEPFDFSMIGYKVGDKIHLTAITGENFNCIIEDGNHIKITDKIYSLSSLAMELWEKHKGRKMQIAGPSFFKIKNKTLGQLRIEIEKLVKGEKQ